MIGLITYPLFISLRWLDVLDILIVAVLLYQLYNLIKGTVAIRIFIGILLILVLWRITVALQMELVANILGQFIGIGTIAFIIIFQPEIRKFLIRIGDNRIFQRYARKRRWKIPNLFQDQVSDTDLTVKEITRAVFNLSATKTGLLMILTRRSDLQTVIGTGKLVQAEITSELIETLFFKNTPLHDGAVIANKSKVIAASCMLPLSDKDTLPSQFGMRHRAAIGLTEQTDALAIVVSEENGDIHVVDHGHFYDFIDRKDFIDFLQDKWLES